MNRISRGYWADSGVSRDKEYSSKDREKYHKNDKVKTEIKKKPNHCDWVNM